MRSDKLWRWALVSALVVIGAGLWRGGTLSAQAQGGGSGGNCCVGVVRLNQVLDKLNEKGVRESQLKRFIEEREKAVNDVLANLKSIEQEVRLMPKDAPDLRVKQEERARLTARAEIEAKIAHAVAEDMKKRMELEMFEKIRDAAGEVAKRRGLSIVINDDSDIDIPETASYREVQIGMISRRLMYAGNTADISSEVATLMNNQFKATPGQ